MKKTLLSLLLLAALLLGACGKAAQPKTTENTAPYQAITVIDYTAVEPDERDAMTDDDRAAFSRLTDAFLGRQPSAVLGVAPERADFLLGLLRESPYWFFVRQARIEDGTVFFDYAYSAQEQAQMQALMDRSLLEIVNADARPEDNRLDTILKIYGAVARRIDYDTSRSDNKQLGSPLFDYPADEVYKALRDGKGLCYGFAYVLRFALLQRGIDAFCVYGECRARQMGHEWVIFRLDDAYYHCDPAWDRTAQEYAKLLHFGKTDAERAADTLEPRSFAAYHEAGYDVPRCTDDRFSIFRGIVRFSYITEHRFYLEDRDEKGYIFDTERFEITE